MIQKEAASVGRVAYFTGAAVLARVRRISDGRITGLGPVEILLMLCHQNPLTSQLITHDTVSGLFQSRHILINLTPSLLLQGRFFLGIL